MGYRFIIFGKIIHTDHFIKFLNKNVFRKIFVAVSLDKE